MVDRLTYDEALAELDEVAAEIAAQRAATRRRDEVIIRAHLAHVPNAVIARRLDITRPTVIRVIRAASKEGEQ